MKKIVGWAKRSVPNKIAHARWARRYRSFAYKDVGKGREQDAEALPNLHYPSIQTITL